MRPLEIWYDDDAGPVVRPYALTGGRTGATQIGLDLIALITATGPALPDGHDLPPELGAIVALCRVPTSVAEIAAHLGLPVGTVRVLLVDLLQMSLIEAVGPRLEPIPARVFERPLPTPPPAQRRGGQGGRGGTAALPVRQPRVPVARAPLADGGRPTREARALAGKGRTVPGDACSAVADGRGPTPDHRSPTPDGWGAPGDDVLVAVLEGLRAL